MTEQQAALAAILLDIDPASQRLILEKYASFVDFFSGQGTAAVAGPLLQPLTAFTRNRDGILQQAEAWRHRLAAEGVDVLPWGDERYPALLREIHHPPPALFVKGDPAVLELPQLAIVGSRNASRGGIDLARNFAGALASAGFVITSGMAQGIDGAAHRGALEVDTDGAATLAVLGTGVDVVYPRQHRQLYDAIAGRGALVSELLPGSPPLRQHFPRRNRIISGLSLGVLVVEAAPRSGSLITARLAMEQGREVFAVPGSVHNPAARGCHQLIREGATLTESVDDIIAQLGGLLAFKAESLPPLATAEGPADPRERAVLDTLGFDPIDYDSLAGRCGFEPASLTAVLVSLEIQGFIENRGGTYLRLR